MTCGKETDAIKFNRIRTLLATTNLPLDVIAQRFGVSRMVIRRAKRGIVRPKPAEEDSK